MGSHTHNMITEVPRDHLVQELINSFPQTCRLLSVLCVRPNSRLTQTNESPPCAQNERGKAYLVIDQLLIPVILLQ